MERQTLSFSSHKIVSFRYECSLGLQREGRSQQCGFGPLKWRKALEINLSELRKSKSEPAQHSARYPDDGNLQEQLQADVAKKDEAIRYYSWLDRLIETFESGDLFTLAPKDLPSSQT